MKSHLIGFLQWGFILTTIFSENIFAKTVESDFANYCIYALERKTDKANQLLDFVESGIEQNDLILPLNDSGNFTLAFEQHKFFGRQSFTPSLVAKLNQIFITVPEYAEHLAELMLAMEWTFVENFKPLQCGRLNQIDTPVDIFKDYVALPVSYGLIDQDNSTRAFIDKFRFRKLDSVSQVGVFFSSVVGHYLEFGSGPYESARGGIKSRVANSLLFRTNIKDLNLQMERLSDESTYLSKKGVRFKWGSCKYTQAEFPNISGSIYRARNYGRPPGWPDYSYLLPTCYKNYSDFIQLKQICKDSENKFNNEYSKLMADLDFMNKTVYSWLSYNLPGSYDSIEDFVATNYWAKGSLKFTNYPHYKETEDVDGFLMNYSYGFKPGGDSLGGGSYSPSTIIESLGDPAIKVNFDWPSLMNWKEFSNRSVKMRKLFQDIKNTEFRCRIDPVKIYHLRKIRVEP